MRTSSSSLLTSSCDSRLSQDGVLGCRRGGADGRHLAADVDPVHQGSSQRGPAAVPLGRVAAGFGNNGQDQTEGCRYRNAFGTYLHGSLLPKNPKLADLLIGIALERKYGEARLDPLDDSLERAAHKSASQIALRGSRSATRLDRLGSGLKSLRRAASSLKH